MAAADAEVFLGRFEIDAVRRSLEQSDHVEARHLLLEHYRQRVADGWLEPPQNVTDLRLQWSALSKTEILARADSILDYNIHPSGIQPRLDDSAEIDWSHNPADSSQWLFMLNRHAWWPILGLAYQLTKNEQYAKAFVAQMASWIGCFPPIRGKDESNPQWRLMETALRLRVSWIPSFGLFFGSSCFTEELKLMFLGSIYDHACFLHDCNTNRNHLIREANGLLSVALWLPEFDRAGDWLDVSLGRLDGQLSEQVNEDGSHIELSTGYQLLAIDEFETTLDLLETSAVDRLQEKFRGRLKTMYEFLAYLVRPDGSIPQINDGFLLWGLERIKKAARRFGQPELEYIESFGESGCKPNLDSRAFGNAGLFVMRSSWKKDANWLLFDSGPYGGPHGHEDKLSIEVCALGKPFLVDTGSYTYNKDDRFRDYFVGSHAHNTIVVDGYSQMRRWQHNHLQPRRDVAPSNHWSSDEHFDYACGQYEDGFGKFSVRKRNSSNVLVEGCHARHVIFVKPDYWCLFDVLMIDGEHQYDQLFHCAPGVAFEAEDGYALLTSGETCLGVVPIGTPPRMLFARGAKEPLAGWYSPDHFKKVPSTTVRFTRTDTGPLIFATVLFPLSQGGIMPSIENLTESSGDSISFTVETSATLDRFSLMRSRRPDDRESIGTVTCIREDRCGERIRMFES